VEVADFAKIERFAAYVASWRAKLLATPVSAPRHAADRNRNVLDPDFNAHAVSAKRRNTGNPWFKRGTLFRSAVDVLRRATAPMTARQIAEALIAGKAPQATRKQAIDLQAAILVALPKRNGGMVVGDGAPARWRLVGRE